jgi:hypothetical protein
MHESNQLAVEECVNGRLELLLTVDEPNVVAYLRGFTDEDIRRDRATEALKVGVIAIRSASPILDTSIVQQKFNDLEGRMKDFLDEFMTAVHDDLTCYFKDQDGVVPKSIDGVFGDGGKLGRTFEQYFDPANGKVGLLMQQQIGPASMFGRVLDPKNKEGILTQIESRIEKLVKEKLDEVLLQFSLDNDTSAMCRLRSLLTDSFTHMQQSLGIKAATAVEAEKGHVKGMEFEADLYNMFALFCSSMGDETENVRGTPGSLRKKTGDYTATLGECTGAPGTRMVVEVKNQRVRLKDAIDELNEAKKNRDATVGIYVFAKGCEPPEVGDFRRVGEDFFCSVDKDQLANGERQLYFCAAYQIARALAVAATRKNSDGVLDLQKLKDHVDALIEFSARLSDVTTKARTVKNSGEAIEKAAESLRSELEVRLAEMQQMLIANMAA